MTTNRTPSGAIPGGAFAGSYANPAVGCPPLMGWSSWDDFIRLGSADDYGESRMSSYGIGAPLPTLTAQTPSANTEIGILRLETDATSTVYEGGAIGLDASPGVYAAGLPPGLWYVAKVRLVHTTDIEAWTGFVSAHARPTSGGGTIFVGFHADPDSTTNWQGVVWNGGTTATVDMGVPASTQWAIMAFRIPEKLTATDAAFGLEFYTVDADQPLYYGPHWTQRGNLVQAGSLPSSALTLAALGVVTTDNASPQRAAEIDFYGVGGGGRR